MRNFIILFHEKTGTSPLVRLLDKFELISILHQVNYSGFEPLDRHRCGRMTLKNLEKCLNIIFDEGPRDMERLNRIYMATAKKPLDDIGGEGVVGFKMRFSPPNDYPLHIDGLRRWNNYSERLFRDPYFRSFKKMMFDTLKRHNVVVLMAIRQDVLRLGLSKYHGDSHSSSHFPPQFPPLLLPPHSLP